MPPDPWPASRGLQGWRFLIAAVGLNQVLQHPADRDRPADKPLKWFGSIYRCPMGNWLCSCCNSCLIEGPRLLLQPPRWHSPCTVASDRLDRSGSGTRLEKLKQREVISDVHTHFFYVYYRSFNKKKANNGIEKRKNRRSHNTTFAGAANV